MSRRFRGSFGVYIKFLTEFLLKFLFEFLFEFLLETPNLLGAYQQTFLRLLGRLGPEVANLNHACPTKPDRTFGRGTIEEKLLKISRQSLVKFCTGNVL